MLKIVIENNGKKAYIDFCNSWDKIHKSIRRLSNVKNITDIYFNKTYPMHITKCSPELYEKVATLINSNNTLFSIYSVCKIIQYADKDFIKALEKQFSRYKSLSDIETEHTMFLINKTRENAQSTTSLYHDPNNEYYQPIYLFGKRVLSTPIRIEIEKLPKGIYRYEIRDDGQGNMCQLGSRILVNHWCTILSDKEIKLNDDGYRNLDEEKDIDYINEPIISLKQYIKESKMKEKSSHIL